MGWFEVMFRASVLVGFVAMFFTLPMFSEYRQQLDALFSTCPMHWLNGGHKVVSTDSDPVVDLHSVVRVSGDKLFSVDELSRLDGRDGSGSVYIAILGSMYDVSAGRKHYGPDGSYSFFAGKDASRAFVTGEFTEAGLIDDLSDLTSAQWLQLLHWFHFYEKTYRYAGKLIGRFYDDQGKATDALIAAQSAVDKALLEKERDDDQLKIFPPCNSQWSEASGSIVWCADKSGGISRDWAGVPRKFFDTASQLTRCVCVRTTGPPSDRSLPDTGTGDLGHPSLREYVNCPGHSNTCAVL